MDDQVGTGGIRVSGAPVRDGARWAWRRFAEQVAVRRPTVPLASRWAAAGEWWHGWRARGRRWWAAADPAAGHLAEGQVTAEPCRNCGRPGARLLAVAARGTQGWVEVVRDDAGHVAGLTQVGRFAYTAGAQCYRCEAHDIWAAAGVAVGDGRRAAADLTGVLAHAGAARLLVRRARVVAAVGGRVPPWLYAWWRRRVTTWARWRRFTAADRAERARARAARTPAAVAADDGAVPYGVTPGGRIVSMALVPPRWDSVAAAARFGAALGDTLAALADAAARTPLLPGWASDDPHPRAGDGVAGGVPGTGGTPPPLRIADPPTEDTGGGAGAAGGGAPDDVETEPPGGVGAADVAPGPDVGGHADGGDEPPCPECAEHGVTHWHVQIHTDRLRFTEPERHPFPPPRRPRPYGPSQWHP